MAKKKPKREGTVVNYKGIDFVVGRYEKFDKDFYKVKEILDKGYLSERDRVALLRIYETSWHDDGKIEGITSCDSSCNGCKFCQKMMALGEKYPTVICANCYDKKQEGRWIAVRNRHGLSMLIMMSVEFTEDELRSVRVTDITRINSSGDTPNVTYALNMLRLAYVNPFVRFGYWAKNTAPVIEACDRIGKPSNVILVQSSLHIGRIVPIKRYFDYLFVVFPDEESTLEAIRNGASACNGKKCMNCGFKCYYGTHKSKIIAECARGINKKMLALILEILAA